MERWVLQAQVVESPREGEANKLGRQAILSRLGVIVRSGMVVIVVVVAIMAMLPMPWRGMAWCHSASRDSTVGMAVAHQLSYAMWLCRAPHHRLLFS